MSIFINFCIKYPFFTVLKEILQFFCFFSGNPKSKRKPAPHKKNGRAGIRNSNR